MGYDHNGESFYDNMRSCCVCGDSFWCFIAAYFFMCANSDYYWNCVDH